MVAIQNFECHRGKDFVMRFTVVDGAGNAKSLVGAQAVVWIARRQPEDTANVLSKALGSGIAILDPASNGQLDVTLSEADLAALSGMYAHELGITDADGNDAPVAKGVITVNWSITE